MPVTLPIEIYKVFERGFGKEDAKKVVKCLESVIEGETVNKWHQTKTELKDELLKEVATKKDLEIVRVDMEGKIDKLSQKFNFMIILLIIALTLMNPVVAEIIKGWVR